MHGSIPRRSTWRAWLTHAGHTSGWRRLARVENVAPQQRQTCSTSRPCRHLPAAASSAMSIRRCVLATRVSARSNARLATYSGASPIRPDLAAFSELGGTSAK